MSNKLYDNKNPQSIEEYAKKLIGHTFQEVVDGKVSDKEITPEQAKEYSNKNRKGGLGNLLEEVYFNYKANSKSEADFKDAGVELKATPYEITKAGKYKAGERLVLSMINYSGEIEPTLIESHLWEKSKLLLLVYYLRNKALHSNLDYSIDYVTLFTPTETDLAIIANDYKIIADKVRSGKAEQLSESDTFYLGACTKGATAEKSIVNQFYPPHTPAKKRAFCYKNSYMTHVLNEYIIAGKNTYEPCETIIKDAKELENTTFADLIISKINAYKGKTDRELCVLFEREYNNNKAQWTDLAYRMLGIKSNRAEEFRKANITVKVIRIEENRKMNENLSFPTFKYREIIQEEWEDSTLHNYFDETKFLFVIFSRVGDCYALSGCKLWNMPYDDLNTTVREGWQNVVDTIKRGVRLDVTDTAAGPVVRNNLPKKSDNAIIHVRPHASKRYFEFLDGTILGDGCRTYANQLPDGTWMPNYCFWINNDYILEQLEDYDK